MTGWRGVLAGFLGLAGLYALVTSQSKSVTGLTGGAVTAAHWFLDPSKTLFSSTPAKKASLTIPAGPSTAPLVLDPNAPTITKTA